MASIHPAREAFLNWLPGELVYSAKKAPYPEKIRRANLAIDDPQSVHTFLSAEWFHHRFMRDAGKHHSDEHEKTAQLQLAKFAAGLYDKAALARWLAADDEARDGLFVIHALDTANAAHDFHRSDPADVLPEIVDHARQELALPFEHTVFNNQVISIMGLMTTAANALPDSFERQDTSEELFEVAFSLGHYALDCYEAYATDYLEPEQYSLAQSELA